MHAKQSGFASVHPALAAIVVVCLGLISLSISFWTPGAGADTAKVWTPGESADAYEKVQKDLKQMRALIETELRSGRPLPSDVQEVYDLWSQAAASDKVLIDPFSGHRYDYDQRAGAYRVWSTGPDSKSRTDDDIVFDSRGELSDKRAGGDDSPARGRE